MNNTPADYPDQLTLDSLAKGPKVKADMMNRYRNAQMKQARDVLHIREALIKHLREAREWEIF